MPIGANGSSPGGPGSEFFPALQVLTFRQFQVLWDIVRAAAARAGIDKLAPHDLRRTCARLCHLAGGELDQIQFLSFNPPWAIDRYRAGRPRSDNWQRLKQSTLREIGRFSVHL